MQRRKFKTRLKVAAFMLLLVYLFLLFYGCENPFIVKEGDLIVVVTGTVKSGVESDCWILDSFPGKSYELYGEKSSGLKKEGLKARVVGKVLEGPTFCMQGTPLEVLNYKILN